VEAARKLTNNAALTWPAANNKGGSYTLKFLLHPKLQELLKAVHTNLKISENAMCTNTNCMQKNSSNQQEFFCHSLLLAMARFVNHPPDKPTHYYIIIQSWQDSSKSYIRKRLRKY